MIKMKKLFKVIPLLFVPFMATSCSVFNYGANPDGSISYTYPTGLQIEGSHEIFIGETLQLVANQTPSNSDARVIWSSDHPEIVEAFAKGYIKGKAIGNATITATVNGQNGPIIATFDVSCDAPSVDGIYFIKDHKDMRYNTTYQLEPIVTPEFAIDKSVTYTSSDTSIATVDDNGVVTALDVSGTATITAQTNEGGFTATFDVNVKEYTGLTLLIYMCGSDLESGPEKDIHGNPTGNINGLGSLDIQEILSTEGQPEDVNILIETGGASAWKNPLIRNDKLGRWEVRDQQLVEKDQLSDASMGDKATLQSFIEWGIGNYPAEHYGLLMWNHGGAMGGICFDENHGSDSLKADEVIDAVKDAQIALSMTDKLEFIAYDACLMAIQDVAELNSDYFNYMLCSQESEVGTGYDYDAFLPALYDEPGIDGATLLELIGHTYMLEISQFSSKQTQSVYDLSHMSDYKDSFEAFALEMSTSIIDIAVPKANFVTLLSYSKQYGYVESSSVNNHYPYFIYDIENVFQIMKLDPRYEPVYDEIDDVLEKMDDVIIYEEHGASTIGCGMNLYSPLNTSYDTNQSTFTNWQYVVSLIQ